MVNNQKIRKLIYKIINLLLYYKLFIPFSFFFQKKTLILNFHSIFSNYKSYQNNEISFDNFHKFFLELSNYSNIINLTDIDSIKDKNKNYILFSFDDGFLDFLEVVDLFKKYKVKPNLNIIINSTHSNYIPLNMIAQSILNQIPVQDRHRIDFPYISKNDLINNCDISQNVSNIYKNIKTSNQLKLNQYLLSQLDKFSNLKLPQFLKTSNINQIKEYVELGIHSYYHSTMSIEDDTFFIQDLEDSVNFFRNELNIDPKIYAFPNGSYKDSQINILKEKDFNYILMLDYKVSNSFTYQRKGVFGSSLNLISFNSFYRK